MADLNAAVPKGFGLTVNRIKKEKSYYVCDTPDGPRKIAKTPDTAERLLFQHQVKEHVWAAGFDGADRFTLSVSGQPYVCAGGETYVMTPYRQGRETDFESPDDVAQALRTAARFHLCARGVPVEHPAPGADLRVFFGKQRDELRGIVKRVRKQPRLSDFDVLFIKNADFYMARIQEALDSLAASDYAAWRETALAERHVCHNALKEESLLMADNRAYLSHFGEAAIDVQLNDVGALVRRYAQRAGRQALPVRQLLDAYHRVTPLPGPGLAVLYAVLKFPRHFMKIVGQYYSKKRSWTPNAIANRMLHAVEEKEFYEDYINELR